MMKTVWGRLNQPVVLPCDLAMDGQSALGEHKNFLLEWRRNGTLIFNSYGDEPGYSAPDYQGRLGRAKLLDLAIHSVHAEDQNIFACSLTRFPSTKGGGANQMSSKEYGKIIRLIVHSFPQILEPSDGAEFFVPMNGSKIVECLAEGLPSPNIKWKRKMMEGKEMVVNEGPSMEIRDFSPEKEGEYICEADNFEGKATARVQLNMKRPLRIDRLNPSMANKTAMEGASVFWHCAVDEPKMNGRVNIKWSRNGAPINGMEVGLRAHLKDGEFGILRLRRTDSGDYGCEATSSENGQFEHDRLMVHLDVQYKPEISAIKSRRFHTIVSGAEAHLECLAQSNPLPIIIKWTRNGRELRGHHDKIINEHQLVSHVHIPSASLNADAGIYTCEAENSLGTSGPFEIHVIVADAPKFTKVPSPIYRVEAGGHLEVQCEGFAEVPLRKLWTKNGEPFSMANSKLVLNNASHNDHGVYRCILVNSIVSVHKEFQIIVENTLPQCATQIRVECIGPRGLSLSWVPGYSGGNFSQLFRVFYKKVGDEIEEEKKKPNNGEGGKEVEEAEWEEMTELTNLSKLRMESLEPFAEYEMKLEASNKHGQINCTVPGKHYTCAKLPTPANFRLEFMDQEQKNMPILMWDEVKEAKMYRIRYQYNDGTGEREGQSFKQLEDLAGTQFPLPLKRLNLAWPTGAGGSSSSSANAQFVVQAIRPPFLPSDPSKAIQFPSINVNANGNSTAVLLGLLSAGAIFTLLCLALLALFIKIHGKARRNIFVGSREKMAPGALSNGTTNGRMNGVNGMGMKEEHNHQQTPHHDYVHRHHDGQYQQGHFNVNSIGDCPSSSTLISSNQQFNRFGHSVAITRKLFPENYIPTKMAEFDEDELENESFEQFEQMPSCDNCFVVDGRQCCNGSSISANFDGIQSEPPNWMIRQNQNAENIPSKSNSYMEMMPSSMDFVGADEERGSAVDEMLRDKYIFGNKEMLDQMEEQRIQQLRRELVEKYTAENG